MRALYGRSSTRTFDRPSYDERLEAGGKEVWEAVDSIVHSLAQALTLAPLRCYLSVMPRV